MALKSVRVRNFRSIKDAKLDCGDTTVLIGANGSGKSSFLHAIEAFQSKAVVLEADDFHGFASNGQAESEPGNIIISVTFEGISKDIACKQKPYLQDDTITIERKFCWKGDKYTSTLHGILHIKKEFVSAYNSATTEQLKSKYKNLRKSYKDLPETNRVDEMKKAIINYPLSDGEDTSEIRDDGKTFGFTASALDPNRFIRFVHVQAMQDVAVDARESRGSHLTKLMDEVVRKRLENDDKVEKFRKKVDKMYVKMIGPIKDEALQDLERAMSDKLAELVPNGLVKLKWKPHGEFIKMPEADAMLVEDGFESTVGRAGHGIQRALVIAMLEQLYTSLPDGPALDDVPTTIDPHHSTLVLAIDEPELYQHPVRQRGFADLLQSLAERGIQVMYSTHSPHFVRIDRMEQIRRLGKIKDVGPGATAIHNTNMEDMNSRIKKARPSYKDNESLAVLSRLQSIMTSRVNEGFFSDTVVLVEGEEDYVGITEAAKRKNCDLTTRGIPIIPCGGKLNLSRPAAIFLNLGIKVYLIWDEDKDSDGRNKEMVRLMEPSSSGDPKPISDCYACMKPKMQEVLKKDFGTSFFTKCENKCKRIAGTNDKPQKTLMAYTLINDAADEGIHASSTLSEIIDRIIALADH